MERKWNIIPNAKKYQKVQGTMNHILETQELTKNFGGVIANNKINLTVDRQTITGLIGPNGSGKTTFINVISGVFPSTSGKITFKDNDITKMKANEIATLGISRTFQRIRLFEKLTIVENVLVSRKKFYHSNYLDVFFDTRKLKQEEKAQFEYAMDLLKMFGLEDDSFKLPSEIPYGKRRALEIARAMALNPELILLDEPAAGMTKDEFTIISQILISLKEKGITILLIEHTMEFVRQVVDYVYVLNFGELICQGCFCDIEHDERVIKAYLGEETI